MAIVECPFWTTSFSVMRSLERGAMVDSCTRTSQSFSSVFILLASFVSPRIATLLGTSADAQQNDGSRGFICVPSGSTTTSLRYSRLSTSVSVIPNCRHSPPFSLYNARTRSTSNF